MPHQATCTFCVQRAEIENTGFFPICQSTPAVVPPARSSTTNTMRQYHHDIISTSLQSSHRTYFSWRYGQRYAMKAPQRPVHALETTFPTHASACVWLRDHSAQITNGKEAQTEVGRGLCGSETRTGLIVQSSETLSSVFRTPRF